MRKRGKRIVKKNKTLKFQGCFLHNLIIIIIAAFLGILIFIIAFKSIKDIEAYKERHLEGELKTAFPTQNEIHLFPNQTKAFGIDSGGYDEIRWYIDDKAVNEGSSKYDFAAERGNYTIKVEMKNNTRIESRSWEVIIEEDEIIERPLMGRGELLFYFIIALIIIVMALTAWIFMAERRRPNQKNFDRFIKQGS